MGPKIKTTVQLWETEQEIRRIDGVVIGVVTKLESSGEVFVDYPSNPSSDSLPARSTIIVKVHDIGQEVALMFEEGNPGKPIVLGLIQHFDAKAPTLLDQMLLGNANQMDVQVDHERLTLTAEKEVVIKCGEASITLTKAGKILIRGTYVLSSSSGVNRIKGGSVQIN
jgi:hypothetical protein